LIDYLDDLLRTLLLRTGLSASQISFSPPDDDWRKSISGALGLTLDAYLIEFYENAELRTNDVYLRGNGINQQAVRAPARLNCRYLISAWSPAKPTPLLEPAIEEDVLLHQVTTVLMEALPFDANAIYAPNPLPLGFPPDMLDPPLPAVVSPTEPFDKLSDFWHRMDTIWKPVVDLVVTIPVLHAPRLTGPPVTTLFAQYGTVDHPDREERTAIGGVVTFGGNPVSGAWVRLVEFGQMATTNPAGQFIFEGVRRGSFTLTAGAPGHADVTRAIDIPSLSGEYDLQLT
jgi:hypothetical protein